MPKHHDEWGKHEELLGSRRRPMPGALAIRRSSPNYRIEITVCMRAPERESNKEVLWQLIGEDEEQPSRNRDWLARREYKKHFGAVDKDLKLLRDFAEEFDLQWVGEEAGGRVVRLNGKIKDIEEAFDTELEIYASPAGEFRGRRGKLYPPKPVHGIIEGVFGLDKSEQVDPFVNDRPPRRSIAGTWLEETAKRYCFPKHLKGRDQCIGILEFGGGISPADFNRYFEHLGILHPPEVEFKYINRARGIPGIDFEDDREVALDVEVAGSVAPRAKIVVYFAPNNSRGFIHALCAAIHDTENSPTILCISWGETEDWWTPMARSCVNRFLCEAACMGITICAASGDDGVATDKDGYARVTFPASSPFVLACGGTAFDGREEVVWHEEGISASGGGESDFLERPKWQHVNPSPCSPPRRVPSRRCPDLPGRLIPDVAALSNRVYSIIAGGSYINAVGGTSASAALWAGLTARLNEGLCKLGKRRVGYLTPYLYRLHYLQHTFNDITRGNNDQFSIGGYYAHQRWDACTGWGSPNGEKLLEALMKL